MEAFMMDNYEMARGHAAVGLAGQGLGSGRFSSSEVRVTMPLRRREPLPPFALGFSPQSHQASQSHNTVRTQRKGILKIRQACFKGTPPVLSLLKWPRLRSHRLHAAQPQGRGIQEGTWLPGLCENRRVEGSPKNRDRARPCSSPEEHSE